MSCEKDQQSNCQEATHINDKRRFDKAYINIFTALKACEPNADNTEQIKKTNDKLVVGDLKFLKKGRYS